jgi:hypothetical protein
MTALRFVIATRAGYVHGFNRAHAIVTVTHDSVRARRFTMRAALRFIAAYADAGYGLSSDDARVERADRDSG